MGCCGNRGARPTRGTAPASTRSAKSRVVGREAIPAGLVEVEYVGGEAGVSTWFGPVTRRQYRFGGKRTRGFIDQADASEMVGTNGPMGKRGIVVEGRTVFRYASVATPAPVKATRVAGDPVRTELVDAGAPGPQAKPGPSPKIVVDSYGQAGVGQQLPVPPSDSGAKSDHVEPVDKSRQGAKSTINVAEMTARSIIEFVEEYLKGVREHGFDWDRLIADEVAGRNRATVIAALQRAKDKQK